MRHTLSAYGTRIIPAYAGSTSRSQPRAFQPMDHPRIRGEHPIAAKPDNLVMGSSPHTRGAPTSCRSSRSRPRIIPAYAGSTPGRRQRLRLSGDHPRIRGEHITRGPRRIWVDGSSPHTRGAPACVTSVPRRSRIIPAYAGSTACRRLFSTRTADHPRIRGEHDVYDMVTARGRGSSPHTRGARPGACTIAASSRIIPAYAGSTQFSPARSPKRRDHPRIRGEHAGAVQELPIGGGSSPHTRGAPPRSSPGSRPSRIIPAYAGSTVAGLPTGHSRWDHPRIRGEHDGEGPVDGVQGGSSPHTRGARSRRSVCDDRRRIIPAYAGSTIVE